MAACNVDKYEESIVVLSDSEFFSVVDCCRLISVILS